MTDPVLSGLRERLERYRGTGDVDAVLSHDVVFELGALLGPGEGFDAESAYVGGMVHWLRYRAGSTSGEDLAEGVRLLAMAHDRADGYDIPGPVRLVLGCRRGR